MSIFNAWIESKEENSVAYQQEELIAEVTEDICDLLEDCDVSRVELARRMGVKKSHISQVLGGSRNMTLRTLAALAHALGQDVRVNFTPNHRSSETVDVYLAEQEDWTDYEKVILGKVVRFPKSETQYVTNECENAVELRTKLALSA